MHAEKPDVVCNRSIGIDATRTVMNTLIVFHHSGAPFMAVAVGATEMFCCSLMLRVAWTLPSLFCLSGYLMMRGYSFMTIRHKIWSRCKRLAAPLLLVNWGGLLIVGLGLALGTITDAKYNLWWAIKTFFVAKSGTTLATLWYVRTLLIFTVFSPVIYMALRSKIGQVITVFVSVSWCLASTILCLDGILWKVFPSFSILSFLIGGILATNGIDLCLFARRHWLPITFCYVAGTLIGTMRPAFMPYQNGLISALPCLFWFILAEKLAKLMDSKFFRYLCESAFFVFVIHSDMAFMAPFRVMHLIYNTLPVGYLSWPGEFFCSLLTVFVINLSICILLYAVMKKLFPLPTRILNGRL